MASDATFCGKCGAPQIVVNTQSEPDATIPGPSALGGSSAPDTTSYDARQLNWKYALPATLKAGLAMAVACALFARLIPVWMLAGGWLAVTLYLRRRRNSEFALSNGAKLGAVAGLFGFAVFSILISILVAVQTFVLHQGSELRALLRAAIDQAAAHQDPSVRPMLQWMQTPEGMVVVFVTCLFMLLVAFLILCTIGGVFGASVSRRRAA
jgi:hypothetical protein